jgi:L-ribulokinase
MKKYTIGVDFGTLSGRCVVVDVENGEEAGTAVVDYPHGVIDAKMPNGAALPPDTALQHPRDYLLVLEKAIPEAMRAAGVKPEQIAGIGIDATSCTLIPTLLDGTPLCFLPELADNPHAYTKLWKHHSAQDEADKLNDIAAARGEAFLQDYGGKISSEWLFPKLWQILDEAPEVYDRLECFVELTDWATWQLCGVLTRNSSSAGFKAIWSEKRGFPSKDFLKALDPRLENAVAEKLPGQIRTIGGRAGVVTEEASRLTGLLPGTPVAVAHLDAAGALPGAGITRPGTMLAIIGTSTCNEIIWEEDVFVPGICGKVKDSLLPGKIGYESGQSCVGDHFQWFVDNCVPADYVAAAERAGKNIHAYLTDLAAQKLPGESGLVALDWWNGNRSVLVDGKLSGVLLGCTLQTKPEDIYRALVEATAYGMRKIVETHEESGVLIDTLVMCGGIARKNAFAMQVYASVIGKDVHIAGSSQNPALSSAIWAAVAAGKEHGGYDDLDAAVKAMANVTDLVYHPDPDAKQVYDLLYKEYETLHDYFGRGVNDAMKRLKTITEKQMAAAAATNSRRKQ